MSDVGTASGLTSDSGLKDRIHSGLDQANTALSVDFCPWANKYVYWLKNPFWVLMLAVGGSALCGFLVNPLVFFLTGLLILLCGIGVVMPKIALRGIDCKVVFDVPRTRVGTAAIVRLQVRNRWPFPVWGLSMIRGFAQEVVREGDEGVALARVPGWSTVEYSWPFIPGRRGRYPCEAAEVETGFPFGLYYARKAAQVDGHLIVWPRTARLEGVPDSPESSQSEDAYCERRVGDGGDMTGTRPFRNGDSLRRVHWSQTARQQMLIVTERQAPATSSVRVTIDLSHTAHPQETAAATLERCVETAASLCESLHRQHCRVELQVGSQVFVAGEAAAGYQQVMDTLAVAERQVDAPQTLSRRMGMGIRVTTTDGQLPEHTRQIVVNAANGSTGAWIELQESADSLSQLPEQWRRLCRVS